MLRLDQSDGGSIAPLVAGYLSLLVMVALMATNVVSAMAMAHRVQGVADAAIVYAHERSLRVGIPSQSELRVNLQRFFTLAPSSSRIKISSSELLVQGAESILVLCSDFQLPLSPGTIKICKRASAQSFLIPLT